MGGGGACSSGFGEGAVGCVADPAVADVQFAVTVDLRPHGIGDLNLQLLQLAPVMVQILGEGIALVEIRLETTARVVQVVRILPFERIEFNDHEHIAKGPVPADHDGHGTTGQGGAENVLAHCGFP